MLRGKREIVCVLERNPQPLSPEEPDVSILLSLLMLATVIDTALDGGVEKMGMNQEVIISSISGATSVQMKTGVLFSPKNS